MAKSSLHHYEREKRESTQKMLLQQTELADLRERANNMDAAKQKLTQLSVTFRNLPTLKTRANRMALPATSASDFQNVPRFPYQPQPSTSTSPVRNLDNLFVGESVTTNPELILHDLSWGHASSASPGAPSASPPPAFGTRELHTHEGLVRLETEISMLRSAQKQRGGVA